jgi:hypothetical protein
VRFTYDFNFGEKFVAILPIGLVHKKTGIKVVTNQEVKEGEKLPDNYCWFIVEGTNANNVSYEYRYNAGTGGSTRYKPRKKSYYGHWGCQEWVENYINKNYILE